MNIIITTLTNKFNQTISKLKKIKNYFNSLIIEEIIAYVYLYNLKDRIFEQTLILYRHMICFQS